MTSVVKLPARSYRGREWRQHFGQLLAVTVDTNDVMVAVQKKIFDDVGANETTGAKDGYVHATVL